VDEITMKKTALIVIFLSFLFFLNLSWGNEIDIKEIKKFAESGYVDAQLILGLKHLFGDGIPEDNDEAMKWFRKAAAQGSVEAQFFLDLMQNKPLNNIASSQTFKKPETIEVEKTKSNIAQDRTLTGKYIVYLHYSREENKQLMEELSIFLKNKGFEVDGIERVNYKNRDIRYFHNEDKAGALLLKKHITPFIKTYFKNTNIKIVNLGHKYPNAKKGALELWLAF